MSIKEEQQELPIEKIIEEKVYIGNVDYNLTSDELNELLTGYQVESTEIPKKTKRRRGEQVEVGLGFVFVTFKTVDEAKKAIEELNDKEFKGRNIYTRVALPESMRTKKKTTKPLAKSLKKPLPKGKKASPLSSEEKVETETLDETKASKKPAKTSPNKKNFNPRNAKKINKLPLSEGKPSKDTIYINNLDFGANEETLKEFFKELEPTWVDIPKKTVAGHVYRTLKRQNVPIRHRGIGFVRFSSEENQKKAVEKFNGKEINGRPITVSIAIDAIIKPELDGEKENKTPEEESA